MRVYRYPMKLGEKGKMIFLKTLQKWMGFVEFGVPSSLKPTGQLCFMLQSIKPRVASAPVRPETSV